MEKLDKVIAGLTECSRGRERNCYGYLYWDYYDYECVQALRKDAREVIEALRAERDDLRKDVAVLTENLNGAQEMVSRLRRMYGND